MGKALCLTFLLSLLFPQWAIAQQPIAPVLMTPFGDGQDLVLTVNLQYQVLQTTFVIVVPAGFVTDFAHAARVVVGDTADRTLSARGRGSRFPVLGSGLHARTG